MARKPRIILSGYPYHVILRGNNKGLIFFKIEDRHFFLQCLKESKKKTDSKIYSYCFMNNHAHLIIEPSYESGLSDMIQSLGRRYVRYVNDKYQRTGTLWEGRYKSSLIDREEYLLICSRYIELNPVRAGIVKHPKDYIWSSFNFKANGVFDEIVDLDDLYLRLGKTKNVCEKNYSKFVLDGTKKQEEKLISLRTIKNNIIGSDNFINKISQLTKRTLKIRGKGRPKKHSDPFFRG